MDDLTLRRKWAVTELLREHFKKNRVNRMYRMGRCEKCGKPHGYLLTPNALLFAESCLCHMDKKRTEKRKYAHSFVWMAEELMKKERELAMLFDFDLDLLDLEEGVNGG